MKQRRSTRLDRQAGLTLVELMVGLVILSIAITAVLTLGNTLMNSYRESRRAISVERSTRASVDVIATAVRNGSPAIPKASVFDLITCKTDGTLRVTNSSSGPDELELVHAVGGTVTSLRSTFDVADSSFDVSDASELAVGDFVLVSNLDQGALLKVLAIAPSSEGATITVDPATSSCSGAITWAAGTFNPGDLVIRAQVSRFYIDDTATVDYIPTLMMDPDSTGPMTPEPLAAGIEDLQVAIGVDANGDGLVYEDGSTADEWHYNAIGDALPPSPLVTQPRAFRVTVVGRTIVESSTTALYRRPAVEDRPQGSAMDPYRRRTLAATIELRNMEGSR
jgi:prepilin-type N-terminal cleavage/methylation domain-containing protein